MSKQIIALVVINLICFNVNAFDLKNLMQWIASNTHYTQAASINEQSLPFVDLQELRDVERVFGNDVNSVYLPTDNKIVLANTNKQNIRTESILIHELIHFLQIQTNKQANCTQELEFEAYETQKKFLKQYREQLPVNDILYKLLTTCIQKNAWEK